MKTKLLLTLGFVSLLLAGCATHGHGHAMACGKCSCKMMQASATDAHKCAMCGHGDAEHHQPAAATDAAPAHQH